MRAVTQALWIALPVIIGGTLHIIAIRKNVLPPLAGVPLDGGVTVRGRRLFGENKTLRGALLMMLFTIAAAVVQSAVASRLDWARALTPPEVTGAGPLLWGALLGAGYIAGELPNSVIKRQIGIAPGAPGAGALGPVFWVIDQVDSLAGVLVAISFVWIPSWPIVLALLIVTLVVHPLAALGMVALGLKARVG